MADVHPRDPDLEAATMKLVERVVALMVVRNGGAMSISMDAIKSVNGVALHFKIVDDTMLVIRAFHEDK